ncbi:MAG TPA: hypothetical protein PLM52_03235 [Tabrizicola sp.]|nr:hypothetical protein [Tabrizicola sp.]
MARDPVAMTHIAGRKSVAASAVQPRATLAVTALERRPVADVVAAQPLVAREAMLFPTARLDEARVVNPDLFDKTRKIRHRPGLIRPGDIDQGRTRAELGLPVAAADPVDPDQTFQSADGRQALYLPGYALARRTVSGTEQYDLRLEQGSGVWTLRVGLTRQRPAAVDATVTTELEHDLLVQLRYRVVTSDGGALTKTLEFTELGSDASGLVVAGLPLATLGERDQVLAAITSAGSACGIVVTRSVRVAVPAAGQADRYRAVTRGLPQVAAPDPLFLAPALHPYVLGGLAAPTQGPGLVMRQVQFEGAFHDYWQDAVDPTCVYYLPDAFRLARRDSPAPFLPMLMVRIDPGATPEADPVATMELAATPWTNPARLDAARREFAKRLPAQPGDAPTPVVPELGGDLGGAVGGLLGDFLKKNKAAPGTALGDMLTGALGLQVDDARVARMRLEPLPVDSAALWLALPGAAGGGLTERPAAQVDLRTAVILSEVMPLTAFQQVYDALMGGAVSLMRGEVRVTPGGGAPKRIPVELRFDRMNGAMFETTVTTGTEPGHFTIRLVNAVECPVTISGIEGSLLVGGHELPTTESASRALPVTLAPGEDYTVFLVPKRPLATLPGGPKIEPMLDFSRVRLEPDAAALWAAVLDADTTAEARRRVRVKLFPGMFDAPDGKPENRAFAVIVSFENGPSLELTPEASEGEVVLPGGSVTDLVLRRAGTGGYRYKCMVIRRSARITDPDWRSDASDILVPLLPEG